MHSKDDHFPPLGVTRRTVIGGLLAAPAISILGASGACAQPVSGPAVRTFDVRKYTHMLAPRGHGEVLPIQQGYRGRYPSRNHSMQLMVFINGRDGLYIQTKDPEAHITDWSVTKSGKLTITFWGPEPEVVVREISSELEDIAALYRSWALDQFWARKKRSAMDEVNYITMASSNNIANMRRLTPNFINHFPAPTACWITQWRKHPFDQMYPNYEPGSARDVAAFLTELNELQCTSLPYINGCLIDQALINPSNREYLITDENGNVPFYNKEKRFLRYACPGTDYWQNEILSARSSVIDESGAISSGVYYDMVAATDPRLCYSSSHNHSPGDSLIWQTGFREILKKTPGVIMTEGNAEVYLDLVDVLLMHFQTEKPGTVPLWTQVYGDICNIAGWNLESGLSQSEFKKEMSRINRYGAKYFGSPWMKSARQNEYLLNLENPVPPELYAH